MRTPLRASPSRRARSFFLPRCRTTYTIRLAGLYWAAHRMMWNALTDQTDEFEVQ
jgi:hypothetical protein